MAACGFGKRVTALDVVLTTWKAPDVAIGMAAG